MLTTVHGTSLWSTKEFARATGTCNGRASHKVRDFERRCKMLLDAMAALDPTARPCDLASMLTAVMETGGKLCKHDRQKLLQRVRQLAG